MGIMFEIKVVPQSKRQGFALDKGNKFKCNLKSAPEKGKANEELIKLLSKLLMIPQNAIKIVSGQTSRKKVIKIDENVTLETVYARCGIEVQQKI